MHALDPPDSSPLPALTLPRISAWRILLGLLQGLLLYLLYRAAAVRDKLAAGAIGTAVAALPDVVIGSVHARLLTVWPYAPCRNERRRAK